ncbi:hypothetical protein CH063_01159 [Colletotrichum higginsianum]|uniref:MFS maltose permease n=2 Tax=Colletotrichum higginsianum TaxID=80884 RepID=H1V2W5_COLHI|nr:hypothetical protein CH63R_07227 [Colletotrichum higginsianum IMI 349063]OBR08462.1 hypothetical protein CH63R_07227 [Colletotrichum higginsianum IMI 349063]TIC95779.1 hypothetical protein CH35J_008836 [Colletotrichum higginsianum]GJC97462.1 hypothetical protein ColKHC_06288 [Colletotrichum higginsianum]CCF34567.1 hypothetical protein CH063_01159 [Colletotrichum higginsianum]
MRQRLALRRILLQRLFRLQTTRPFTSNTSLTSRSRPQLPFLSIPVTSPRPRVRYFTTEKKQWLRYEGRLFLRYNVSIWGGALCIFAIVFLLNQEALEKDHPTPHEWSFLTRMGVRGAKDAAKDSQNRDVNWVEVLVSCRAMLKRLEDPNIDGAGIRELLEEPLSIDGVGSAGKDLTAKSENWRRGYYEMLMLLAQASEQLDGWVRDTTRNIIFPPEVVRGPSNPHPKPIPAGAESAPNEEDCEVAYEPAENHYLRVLTTKGFTNRQKMDAALRYASFLDYKHLPDAADRMYQWALSLATETTPSSPPLVDPRTYTINDKTTLPSENVLNVLTSIALHKARNGDVNAALPIFVSVLRARRALPQVPLPGQERPAETPGTLWQKVWNLSKAPVYPSPPDDGTRPPWRHPKELCEEAGLNLYIGEILYATKDSKANREEGLAWTRDAVDLAEEQLRKVGPLGGDKEARQTCRECLSTGLQNWSTMVARLAREEEARGKAAPAKSVFGFWSGAAETDDVSRWVAEEKVVAERIRRTRELLVQAEPPAAGLASLLQV